MNVFTFALICIFFATSPIVVSIHVRNIVKNYRRVIIDDLREFFDPRGKGGSSDLIHSFEFVKFKYSLQGASRTDFTSDDSRTNDIKSDESQRDSDEIMPFKIKNDDNKQKRSTSSVSKDQNIIDFWPHEWILHALPLAIILLLLNVFSGMLIVSIFELDAGFDVPVSLGEAFERDEAWTWVFLASYVGAYTFMIRAFYQAINNFDLNPSSFFGAFNNIFTGIALVQIGYFGLFRLLPSENSDLLLPIIIITSFVGGYMPEALLRQTVKRSALTEFKREKSGIFHKFKAVPLEVIDGIETTVRDKLSDFHISSVQNLAAANPIMLFVETPFGIYQMLDWVAQAQLCESVGPDALVKLWDIGIRTIFDLERLAFHEGFGTDELLKSVGTIILQAQDDNKKSVDFDVCAVRASVKMRIDNPYTHRLRQIFIRIGERLGDDARRLPPSRGFDNSAFLAATLTI